MIALWVSACSLSSGSGTPAEFCAQVIQDTGAADQIVLACDDGISECDGAFLRTSSASVDSACALCGNLRRCVIERIGELSDCEQEIGEPVYQAACVETKAY